MSTSSKRRGFNILEALYMRKVNPGGVSPRVEFQLGR